MFTNELRSMDLFFVSYSVDDSLREAMYPPNQEQSRSLESEDKRQKNKIGIEARSQSLESDLQKAPLSPRPSRAMSKMNQGKFPHAICFGTEQVAIKRDRNANNMIDNSLLILSNGNHYTFS